MKDAWLPRNLAILPGLDTGPVIIDGNHYQIIAATGIASKVLLASPELAAYWQDLKLVEPGILKEAQFGDERIFVLPSDERILMPVSECPKPGDINEMLALAVSVKNTRERGFTGSLESSIYVEKISILLALPNDDVEELTDELLIGRYITGGVNISVFAEERILSLLPWITGDDLKLIQVSAGLRAPEVVTHKEATKNKLREFELVGRPALELFFREHVLDILENPVSYKVLGVEFPTAIILHGPPGCGKTYAVEKLSQYLEWPIYFIDPGSVGSPFIHETARKISETFDTAARNAPAMIVIDEMDAFLADREIGIGSSTHRVEEVAEVLRKIPEASGKKILVIGMTNRVQLLDKALLRRGRFDHVIEVGMPTADEIRTLLEEQLAELPLQGDLDVPGVARKLAGRPLSDVTFLVREASRLSAKGGKSSITAEIFEIALSETMSRESDKPGRKIGFN